MKEWVNKELNKYAQQSGVVRRKMIETFIEEGLHSRGITEKIKIIPPDRFRRTDNDVMGKVKITVMGRTLSFNLYKTIDKQIVVDFKRGGHSDLTLYEFFDNPRLNKMICIKYH
jgi:hypothetical protein